MSHSIPILLVDDDDNDVLLTELAYCAAGLSNPLLIVHDGCEAIRYLGGESIYGDRTRYPMPGLVLLGLNMPILTGFNVLEWLQRHPCGSKVVVIVLTASSNPAEIARAKYLGAADYRVKQTNSAHLVPVFRVLLARVSRRWRGFHTHFPGHVPFAIPSKQAPACGRRRRA